MDIPEYAEDLVWKVPIVKNKKNPMKNYKKDQPENKDKFDNKFFGEYDGNWGFYTGENKIAIIDFDCRQNKKPKILKILNKNHNTLIIETKNGFHVYYKINGKFPETSHFKNLGYSKTLKKFYPQNKTKFGGSLEGIDVIAGTNVLVVGENSIINNHIYKAINKNPIKEINNEAFDSILQSYILKRPKKIRDGFTNIFRGKIDPNDLSQETNKTEFVYWKYLYIEALQTCKVEPEYLLDGLEYHNKGFDRNKTIKQLRSSNNPHEPENQDILTPEVYNEYFPDNKIRIAKKKKKTKKSEKKPYIEIANKILNKFDIITMSDSKEILIKGSNIYRKDETGLLNKTINKEIEFRNLPYTSTKGNIIAHIKDKTLFNRKEFCYDTHLINFENGYFDLEENKFYDKTDKIFPFQIPHNYEDGEYDCPKYKDALNKWLTGNSVFKPSDMFEMLGYCMTLDISQKKAFMIYGDRDTGKTQNLSIILAIIGKQNYAMVELQRLGKDQFGTEGLEFTQLCVDDDLPSYKLRRAHQFKKMVGGLEQVGAEKKGGNKYKFRNTVRFIFNCNSIPKAPDAKEEDKDAFFIRWLLCNFCNKFDEDSEDTIKDFAKTIINDPEEIQGIIHESIKGVQRLRERGHFRKELRDNTKKVWQSISDPLFRFIEECCVKGVTYEERTTTFRDVLNAYLMLEDEDLYSPQKLVRDMEKLKYRVRRTDKRRFQGLKIKNSVIEKFEDLIGMTDTSPSEKSNKDKGKINFWN
jgi:phage/plasmid-associated DNA primase